jgi:hypothetical protein
MLTATQAQDVCNVVEAAVIAGLESDPWFRTTIVEAGDSAGQTSGWAIAGASAANTDDGRLWWSLDDVDGTRRMRLWSDDRSLSEEIELANEGFEAGDLTGWTPTTVGAPDTSEISGTRAHTGSWSYRLVEDDTPGQGAMQAVTLVRGATYEFGGWVWAVSSAADNAIRITLHGGTNGFDAFHATTPAGATGRWYRIRYQATIPTSYTNPSTGVVYTDSPRTCYVQLRGIGEAYFDDLYIRRVYPEDLVAEGTRTGDGAITLAAANGSGLSGSVMVAYTADDGDAGNTLDVGYGQVRKIAAKYLPIEQMALWKAILPGIAVVASGPEEIDSTATAGAYDLRVPVLIDYYRADGDIAAGIDRTQEALARLLRWSRDEMHATSGSKLNGLLTAGGGTIRNRRTSGPALDQRSEKSPWESRGQCMFDVILEVAG